MLGVAATGGPAAAEAPACEGEEVPSVASEPGMEPKVLTMLGEGYAVPAAAAAAGDVEAVSPLALDPDTMLGRDDAGEALAAGDGDAVPVAALPGGMTAAATPV